MHPLAEYPRPAMRRDSCEILNGPWQYAITQTAEYPAAWQGSILVPYSPEAPASGVGRTLQPGQWLHYHRLFAPPAGRTGGGSAATAPAAGCAPPRRPGPPANRAPECCPARPQGIRPFG